MKNIKIIGITLLAACSLQAITPLPEDRKIKRKEADAIAGEIIAALTAKAKAQALEDTIAAQDARIAQATATFNAQECERKERIKKRAQEYQEAMFKQATIDDVSPEVEFIPAKEVKRKAATIAIADAPITTESIEPELPEDVRAQDRTVMDEVWSGHEVHEHNGAQVREILDAHEVHKINKQELNAVIAAERAKIEQQKQASQNSVMGSLTGGITYYWEQYRELNNNQKTALSIGLGALLAYVSYKGVVWAYSKWHTPKKVRKIKKKKIHAPNRQGLDGVAFGG